jgi:hypothetical protein
MKKKQASKKKKKPTENKNTKAEFEDTKGVDP